MVLGLYLIAVFVMLAGAVNAPAGHVPVDAVADWTIDIEQEVNA